MSLNFELLKRAALEDKLFHLLLFHGSGTEERRRAVLELAAMLNCKEERKPCGECPACKKLRSGNHPDFYLVLPLKTSVGIEQVLALQEKIYRRIYEGKYRVCLIEEADKLTLPAANALLKIAEEPPENTVLILSSGNSEAIIPTLRSRAQAVFFPFTASDFAEKSEELDLSGGDPDLMRNIQKYGTEKIKTWLQGYWEMLESGDFLKAYPLFSTLEKEESNLLLQVLAVALKARVVKGELSPQYLIEIGTAQDFFRKQVNHRLVLEVLALKHISLGGNGNWLK